MSVLCLLDRRWLLGCCALLLAACTAETPRLATPRYVTTIPPFGMIIAPLAEPHAAVDVLLAAGASPHTHDHRPSDVRAASGSTALFYGAPVLDGWAADIETVQSIALAPLVPESLRLALPGGETDPHFWTDPLVVRALLPALADTLCALDDTGCTGYRARADAFAAQLDALDADLRAQLAPLAGRRVLLAEPFLLYFLRRYGLDAAGSIEPVPGAEPSPKALQRLIRQVEAEGIAAILTLPQLPARAARAVAEATGVPVVELDPLGGGPGRDTYDALLRYNARVLQEALTGGS